MVWYILKVSLVFQALTGPATEAEDHAAVHYLLRIGDSTDTSTREPPHFQAVKQSSPEEETNKLTASQLQAGRDSMCSTVVESLGSMG